MTYEEAYKLIEPKTRTQEEVIYWCSEYLKMYDSDLKDYVSFGREYSLNQVLSNHLGYTIFMLEKIRRDYCE